MAHLTANQYSLFVRLLSSTFFVFISPSRRGPSWASLLPLTATPSAIPLAARLNLLYLGFNDVLSRPTLASD